MSRVSRAVQADRGEISLSSLLFHRCSCFSLGQEARGERSLMDGLSDSFRQINHSSSGIEATAEMSVMEESPMPKHSIIEQEASGERSETLGARLISNFSTVEQEARGERSER